MKKLIIYYSLTGGCKYIAELFAQKVGADILELKPKKDIKKKGLMRMFWGGRQVLAKETPELENFDINPNNYDLLIFGTPVWVGTFVPAMRTFLNENKFHNKKYIIFSSCGGSPSKTVSNFEAELEGNDFMGSISFNDKQSKEEIESQLSEWVDRMKLK